MRRRLPRVLGLVLSVLVVLTVWVRRDPGAEELNLAEFEHRLNAGEVAEATIRCLKAAVPASLPGIVFLSGGQSDEQATAHLNAMNQMGPHPWPLSFSYGRAMQQAALKLWGKDMQANFAEAQKTVALRAKDNGLAALGQWKKVA